VADVVAPHEIGGHAYLAQALLSPLRAVGHEFPSLWRPEGPFSCWEQTHQLRSLEIAVDVCLWDDSTLCDAPPEQTG
jgi:hypothetical protein